MPRIIKAVLLLLLPFAGSAQVTAVKLIVHVPQPAEGKSVYVAGSFNGWKAADSLYRMKTQDGSTYTIVLPVYKNAKYQYKYMVGNWSGVELASNDSAVKNRSFFTTNRKTKITDTVLKWAAPKPSAKQSLSPQMAKINAMKDSALNGLQPKLNEMLQLLREYTINLLQDHPSAETDNRITADVMKHFMEAYGTLNGLFHKIFQSLTPEQKQKVLKAVTAPGADKDFINTLGAAVNEAVK